MAIVYKPPAPVPWPVGQKSVFLAGSIDMGQAVDWRADVVRAFPDDVVILNPLRDAWDKSWRQSMDDDRFRGQVEWELEGLERADLVAVYFSPGSKAPVTMLELGLYARSGKMVVCAADGFWRRGNIEVTCARYGVPRVETLTELVAAVQDRLGLRLR